MSLLYLVGDSHLFHCYNVAVKDNSSTDFGYTNVKAIWDATGIDQIKLIDKAYKDCISKNGVPYAAFVMCGGYDLMLTKDVKGLVDKLKKLIHVMSSSNVKCIVVCSIVDRLSSNSKDDEIVNKEIRNANKMLARVFKNNAKVFFINVRPPGKTKDIIDTDKFHLKEEGYNHMYKKLVATVEERVIPHIPNAKKINEEPKETSKNSSLASFKEGPKIDKRLTEFKDILKQDYKRICLEETSLTVKYKAIQKQLDETSKEKKEVVDIYKKLFGVDLYENVELKKEQTS